jgi:hypothetical protein
MCSGCSAKKSLDHHAPDVPPTTAPSHRCSGLGGSCSGVSDPAAPTAVSAQGGDGRASRALGTQPSSSILIDVLLSSATRTNNDPIAGGIGFLIIGALVLIFAALARWRGWKVLHAEGPYSFRSAVGQGAATFAVGLAMLLYGLARQR